MINNSQLFIKKYLIVFCVYTGILHSTLFIMQPLELDKSLHYLKMFSNIMNLICLTFSTFHNL